MKKQLTKKSKKFVSKLLCGALLAIFFAGCGTDSVKTNTDQTAEVENNVKTEQIQDTENGYSDIESETVKLIDAVTFTDDLGREVTVENPKRVVALTASFADIWHLAGGIESLIGTTNATWTYFDLPLREDIVNLGSSKELNQEQLLACEPDFVLASCGTDRNVELETFFEQTKITVAYFSVNNFEDYLRMLDICTQITGCTQNYEQYGTDVAKTIETALQRVDGSVPSVLYIRASGKSCKVKNSEGSVLGEMLADMGCVNIADSNDSLLEQLSMEVILEQDPDYIFVVLQSEDPSDAEEILQSTLLSNPAWAELTAVKEGRYYVMDSNLYNMKPDAKWGEAYEQLADILYPQQ